MGRTWMAVKKIFFMIDQWQSFTERALSVTGGSMILILTILTTADVCLRYLFNNPIPGVYELSELMLIGIVFLSIAYVQANRGHIRIEILTSLFSPTVKFVLNIFAYASGIFVFILITWRSGYLAWQALVLRDYTGGLVQWPIWPAKAALSVGSGLICLRLIRDLYKECIRSKGSNP